MRPNHGAAPSDGLQEHPVRDAIEPGAKTGLGAKVLERAPGQQTRLLREIVCPRRIAAGEPSQLGANRTLMTPYELSECDAASVAQDLRDESGIVSRVGVRVIHPCPGSQC